MTIQLTAAELVVLFLMLFKVEPALKYVKYGYSYSACSIYKATYHHRTELVSHLPPIGVCLFIG